MLRVCRSFIGGALLLVCAIDARATCGSATCFLVTGGQEGVREDGNFRFDLSYRYVDQTRRLSGTDEVGEVLVPKVDFENGVLIPDHHREISTYSSTLQGDLAYGITPRLTLVASLPLIVRKDHEHFDDVGSDEEHFTNADGTNGLGDLQVGVRGALLIRGPSLLVGGAGVKLATGPYRLLDGEGSINEPGIQPGTGSTDWLGSLYYVRQGGKHGFEWFVSGSYRLNGTNNLEYRMGDESLLNAGIRLRPGERATWSVQLNRRHTGRDEFLGSSVPHTGADLLMLSPGVELALGAQGSIYAAVQLPIQERVNESQLAPKAAFLLGVSRSF